MFIFWVMLYHNMKKIKKSNVILNNRIFEYMKLIELAIIIVLGSVDDKHTFSTINFMKSKLKNQLITNFDLVVGMYVQDAFTLQYFPFHVIITNWNEAKSHYGLELYHFKTNL
jgi:hypothetical protein